MTKFHQSSPILMKFSGIWVNLFIFQLFRPEREKLHFHAPASMARIGNDEFYIISMFRQEIYVNFM